MRLITKGLGAHDIDIDLAPLTLVRSANASGKSSLLNALTYCLLGFVPKLGRTAAATGALLRGREMTVRIELGAHWIERTLRRKAKGGFESECRASFCTGTRNEEHEAAVLELVGGSVEEAAESLDVTMLIRLPANQREGKIQQLLERAADPDGLALAVARRWMQILAGVADERMPDDHTALRPLIPGFDTRGDDHTGQYASLRAMAGQMKAKIVGDGIAGALVWANERKRQQTAQLTDKKKAKREFEERLQATADPDPDEIARLEERRAGLDQQIGAAIEREGARARCQQTLNAAEAAHRTATQAAAAARTKRQAFEDQAAELPAWREQLAAASSELDALVAPTLPHFAEAEALERRAGEETTAAAAIAVPADVDLAPLRTALEQARAAVTMAERSPWARAAAIAAEQKAAATDLAKGRNLVAKAFAGTLIERMDELAQLAALNGPGDYAARLRTESDAEEALAEAVRQQAEHAPAREQALAARRVHEDAARDAAASAEDIRARLTEAYRTDRALHENRQGELRTTRDRLTALVNGHGDADVATREAVVDAEQALAAAAQRLADLQATTVSTDETADQPTAAALTTERAQVQQQLGVLTAAQATRAEFRRLVAEIEALEVAETVSKALERALQRVRADEIAHGAEPLLSIMRQFLEGAGRTEVPYLLGWTPSSGPAAGEQVPVEGLSGSEFALWASALAAAVIIRRGAPRKFLLVEAAEADATTLTQLMRGIAAVADRLTLSLVATPHSPEAIPPGWVAMAPTGAVVAEAHAA
jgi:hypothetical protein